MHKTSTIALHAGTLALLGLIFVALTLRLADFPGLHGDEAWAGLEAMAIRAQGLTSLHGMHSYTGVLFPRMVAAQFAQTGASMFSLRLPGALCNGVAMAIVAATLWKRGLAAFFAVLLFASSLLFLFYSRVAWEVSALQNLLLAIILAALTRLLRDGSPAPGWAFAFFLAFALGVWNHFIFFAAALSLALASGFLMMRQPDLHTGRAALLGLLNLGVLAILVAGKLLMPDGAFPSHGLPALLAALASIAAASAGWQRWAPPLSQALVRYGTHAPRPARWLGLGLAAVTAAILLFSLPLDGVSFFGTVSGYIIEARVASHIATGAEWVWLHAAMAVLAAALVALALRNWKTPSPDPASTLKRLLPLWTILFFPALRVETPHALDHYYVIPQFLFFCALALGMEDLPRRWRLGLLMVAALSLLHSQAFFWRVAEQGGDDRPVDFHYGLYEDTSQHFRKIDPLAGFLRERGLCRVRSSSYFIAEPLRFLFAAGPACHGDGAVQVEYCDNCRQPVAGFAISVAPDRSGTTSSRKNGKSSGRIFSGQ